MDAIEAYFTNLSRLLEKTLRSQRNAMEESARRIANAIRNGGMVYTFGTGHGHLLALEVFYRAGGLACVCPMLEEALMLHRSAAGSSLQERDDRWVDILLEKYPVAPGDVCIVASNSGRNAVPSCWRQRLRAQGTLRDCADLPGPFRRGRAAQPCRAFGCTRRRISCWTTAERPATPPFGRRMAAWWGRPPRP